MSHLDARILEIERENVMNTSSSDIVDASASLLNAKASLGLDHLNDNLDSRLTTYLSYSCRYNRRNVCISVHNLFRYALLLTGTDTLFRSSSMAWSLPTDKGRGGTARCWRPTLPSEKWINQDMDFADGYNSFLRNEIHNVM